MPMNGVNMEKRWLMRVIRNTSADKGTKAGDELRKSRSQVIGFHGVAVVASALVGVVGAIGSCSMTGVLDLLEPLLYRLSGAVCYFQ